MNIRHRIEKIEAKLNTKSGAILLTEPDVGALESEYEKHRSTAIEALQSGLAVVIVRNGESRLRIPGATYVENQFDGLLAVLAATPAEGYPSALHKLIRDVQGTTLPVVKDVQP